MFKLLPIILPLVYGYFVYKFSAWQTVKELKAKSKRLRDPAFEPMLERLAAALQIPQVIVKIYEISPVNGLAAPNGEIFITRGFYDKFKAGEVSDEELASVIAHELGHVALGHSRRRMIDFSGQNALRMALGAVISRFIPGIGPWIARSVTSLLAARLSRKDEYEADEYAAALMSKAGFGVAPQIAMFEKLEHLTGAVAGKPPAWLLSHPKTSERIAALRALEDRWSQS
ncbi:M48 family metallopeptidase [Lentibacter algarum]|uniref:M48 family metallopeptidase n=1 Tax=Lentibacter algarum TaxID=576131 RepID=UPI001C065E10|nr:M48 family metallopeptidase [Lentibacter algarum]MBU2980831.1 M48 family metallopeptidase [Lentibacter algarum]